MFSAITNSPQFAWAILLLIYYLVVFAVFLLTSGSGFFLKKRQLLMTISVFIIGISLITVYLTFWKEPSALFVGGVFLLGALMGVKTLLDKNRKSYPLELEENSYIIEPFSNFNGEKNNLNYIIKHQGNEYILSSIPSFKGRPKITLFVNELGKNKTASVISHPQRTLFQKIFTPLTWLAALTMPLYVYLMMYHGADTSLLAGFMGLIIFYGAYNATMVGEDSFSRFFHAVFKVFTIIITVVIILNLLFLLEHVF